MLNQIGIILVPFSTIIGAVVLGMIMRATGIFKGDEAGLINRIVLTVLLPVLVFVSINSVNKDASGKKAPVTPDILKIPLVAFLVIGISGLLAYVAGRYLLRLDRRRMGAFMLTSMFGSTGFIALPLVKSIYGSPLILQHAFYSELGSLTLLVTVGIGLASFYGEKTYGEKRKFNWRVLLEIPKNGPFLGLVLGLLFYTLNIPKPVFDTLQFLSQAALPLMMFSLGLTIVWKDVRRHLVPVLTMNVIKLIFAPLLALTLARIFQLDSHVQGVIVLNAATPAVIICLVYAAPVQSRPRVCQYSSVFQLLLLPADHSDHAVIYSRSAQSGGPVILR